MVCTIQNRLRIAVFQIGNKQTLQIRQLRQEVEICHAVEQQPADGSGFQVDVDELGAFFNSNQV
ncbi:hypothetical protein CGZ77_11590 [Neisseria sp. KEM232]|nr:hypothetical protein CGZ77_11590 [Neisseria sp. KEM232]